MIARACAIALALPLSAAAAHAQQPPAAPGVPPAAINPAKPDDVTSIAQGWLLLSQGGAVAAAERARDVLARSPHNPAASALAIEASMAHGGSAAGLTEYERLLGARTFEEPLLLRRVSQALLREAAAQTADQRARLTALRALAANGDAAASAELSAAMASGNETVARVLAESGNADAIKQLIDGINARIFDPVSTLKSLSRTRNAATVTLAMKLLDDPRSEMRGAAIQALARMRAKEAIPKLRTLLKDERPFIRVDAATALLKLGDDAGLPLIQELAASDAPRARLDAAEALADRQDAAWVDLVRRLTTESEPEIRAGAARLIAPLDPQLAESVFAALQNDPNPAVRTLASAAILDAATFDLRRLRGLMHTASLDQRVLAAERVLVATR
jgi:HEAT repeat protein